MKSYGQIAYEANIADLSEIIRPLSTQWERLDQHIRDRWETIGTTVAAEADRRAAPTRFA